MKRNTFEALQKAQENIQSAKELLPQVEDENVRHVLQCLTWAAEHSVQAQFHSG
jgi:hypothetical protein